VARKRGQRKCYNGARQEFDAEAGRDVDGRTPSILSEDRSKVRVYHML